MSNTTKLPEIPPRKADSHKGDFGRVLILAGSVGLTGAAYLASKGCLRAGAGLVILGTPRAAYLALAAKLTCAMPQPLTDTEAGSLSEAAYDEVMALLDSADVLAMGPGLSQHPETQALVRRIVKAVKIPTVIDADGLNALAGHLSLLKDTKAETIVTPHPGEMARLLECSGADVQNDRQAAATQLATQCGVIAVLKGHQTIVTDGAETYVNPSGNPGMATGGTGDILTGMIAALRGIGMAAFDAAKLAVYLHGTAGDIARDEKGEISLIATDLLNALPQATMKYLRSNK